MMTNRAPKYGKVELLLKTDNQLRIDRVEYEDCGLMITGDYIVVIIDSKDEINDTLTSTGQIYPLSQVSAYKTHAQ
jgi:hypothetical protein